jgi:hypothetical protein
MATVLSSVYANGGRASRYDDFVIVTMDGGCSFATTPEEFDRHQDWARTRGSSGLTARDCNQFVDRFGTVIGREGSGVVSKGAPLALARIIKAMRASAIFMTGWGLPVGPEPAVAAPLPIEPAAN